MDTTKVFNIKHEGKDVKKVMHQDKVCWEQKTYTWHRYNLNESTEKGEKSLGVHSISASFYSGGYVPFQEADDYRVLTDGNFELINSTSSTPPDCNKNDSGGAWG